jgi:uncharacterized protein (UPF0333 family)
MKKIALIIIMSVVTTLTVTVIVPSMTKDKIHKEAPALLELNNFTIVQEVGFNGWQSEIEYVVEKNNKKYNVYVKLSRGGVLVIQPK